MTVGTTKEEVKVMAAERLYYVIITAVDLWLLRADILKWFGFEVLFLRERATHRNRGEPKEIWMHN